MQSTLADMTCRFDGAMQAIQGYAAVAAAAEGGVPSRLTGVTLRIWARQNPGSRTLTARCMLKLRRGRHASYPLQQNIS